MRFTAAFTCAALAALTFPPTSGFGVVWPRLGAFQQAADASAPVVGAGNPVTLDVVVTDAKSRPVKDLQPDDLELTDSGEPRVVDTVRLQTGGGRIIGIFLDEFHVRP